MGDLRLEGCRVEPLGSYLKALGVFRVVAEQLDPNVTGRWDGEVFVLETNHPLDYVIDFFVEDYCPTPIVTPWNGDGGFLKESKTAGIGPIESSSTPRLDAYRRAIAAGRRVVASNQWESAGDKATQVALCRANFPDEAVQWLDAAVVLTGDTAVYPPLLGTGGNIGRLELSNNLMHRLADILCLRDGRGAPTSEDSRSWMTAAVAGDGAGKLLMGNKANIGQFDPGGAGGANSGPRGDAGSAVNPWDYVLLFEGALFFASGAARRMGSEVGGKAAIPFMTDTSAVAFSTAAPDESAKGELWAPLWVNPVGMGELQRLMSEGRSEWRGSAARDGVDFVRALGSLGVDRGIDSFVRYVFVERHGQNSLAVPTGRIEVRERPEVPVLGALDPWLGRVRWQKNAPSSVASLVRQVDESQFDAATGGGPRAVQQVLSLTARLEQTVARSTNLREKVSPISGLSAADWIPALDDGSPELRLAVAFASQGDGAGGDRTALYFRPVETSGRRLDWRNGGHRIDGVGLAPISTVLAAVLERRVIDIPDSHADQDLPQVGVQAAFRYRIPAPLEDVGAFLNGEVDDERLASLVAACCLLDFGKGVDQPAPPSGAHRGLTAPALAVLAPFNSGRELLIEAQEVRLVPAASWPRLLRSGRVSEVIDDALQRLKVARLVPLLADAEIVASDIDATRLAAALTFPISLWAANGCLEQVAATTADPPNSPRKK